MGDILCLKQGGIAVVDPTGGLTWGDHFFEAQIIVPDASVMSLKERDILEKLASLIMLRKDVAGEGPAYLEPWW